MARKPRVHFPTALYHVIARGNQRQAIFLDERDFRTYLSFLAEYKSKHSFHLYAYALMKNHVLCCAQHKTCYVKFRIMWSWAPIHCESPRHFAFICGPLPIILHIISCYDKFWLPRCRAQGKMSPLILRSYEVAVTNFFLNVKKKVTPCVAHEKMSPLIPKLKCPHERGKDLNEPEAVTEVSSCWVGRKWKNYFRGGCSENRGLLPASQANLQKDQGKRSLGTPAWECRPLSSTWNLRFIAKEHPSL